MTERFHVVSKVMSGLSWFRFTSTLFDWFETLAPISQPMRSKTNRDLPTGDVYSLRILIGSVYCLRLEEYKQF